ncbi:unnamed protein product [Ambrosiozyma monospora]|uniref:Unnamed protein product n=1 Tax=Ambrosiozyma monospora TaxID=43982 RepID=A0ACB5STE3_AMBMO|nr:unnamed protein product [Ambrosiozyma monospora]
MDKGSWVSFHHCFKGDDFNRTRNKVIVNSNMAASNVSDVGSILNVYFDLDHNSFSNEIHGVGDNKIPRCGELHQIQHHDERILHHNNIQQKIKNSPLESQ